MKLDKEEEAHQVATLFKEEEARQVATLLALTCKEVNKVFHTFTWALQDDSK